MYFKKLEIYGFKSFSEKTQLHFEPGVTAIVGPNGCGKSNITDAIRWVLGEQSAKALRGVNMEDMIFNGSDGKPPIGFATVSLTFSNETKFLPIDYDEVTVTRKIYRSGESEYLLNKTQVRLKDIVRLFMDTGIGSDTYTIIGQGKIDLILSSKPEERRSIFEEASGIKKYKSEKEEALRRLEQTENNLVRVNDIITEVKRQMNSIERQANKARQYKVIFEKLKDMEIRKSKFEYRSLKTERERYSKEIGEIKEQETSVAYKMTELYTKIKSFKSDLSEIERKLSETQTKSITVSAAIDRNKNKIAINKERCDDIGNKNISLSQEIESINGKILSINDEIKGLKDKMSTSEAERKGRKDRLEQKENYLVSITKEIEIAQKNISKGRIEIVNVMANQSKMKNDITKLSADIMNYQARLKRLSIEKTNISKEKTETESKISAVISEIDIYTANLSERNGQIDSACAELDCHRRELEDLSDKLQNLKNETLTLESRIKFLEDLKHQYEGLSQSVKAVLLTDQVPEGETSAVLGKRMDLSVNIDPEYNKLISDLLKDTFGSLNSELRYLIPYEAKFLTLDAEKLVRKIEMLKEEISGIYQTKQDKESLIESAAKKIEDFKKALHQEEIKLADKESLRRNIEAENKKLEDEISLVNLEIDETTHDMQELEEKRNGLKEVLDKIEQQIAEIQNMISDNQALIVTKSQDKETTIVEIGQIKTELASADKEEEGLARTLKMLDEALNRENSNLESRKKEVEESLKKKGELETESLKLEAEIQVFLVDKGKIEDDFVQINESRRSVVELIDGMEVQVAEEQMALDKIKESFHRLNAKDTQLSFEEEKIKDRIKNTYKVDMVVDGEISEGDEWKEESDEEISELKDKMDSMGSVNLVAIEEQQELESRISFLTNQGEDLLNAKDSLHKAIIKINKTAKDLFMETFEKIGEEFRKFFRILFGGGTAELYLLDEDDALESGIEIVAQPPGKKLQNISLLSGGEKAMTAIALLFAIFKVKPSPFCVLDEIDASLDESNIDRFSRLLQDFVKTSQFIIITHSKKTINVADVMYGITMEQSGVSKIVSVKFREPN